MRQLNHHITNQPQTSSYIYIYETYTPPPPYGVYGNRINITIYIWGLTLKMKSCWCIQNVQYSERFVSHLNDIMSFLVVHMLSRVLKIKWVFGVEKGQSGQRDLILYYSPYTKQIYSFLQTLIFTWTFLQIFIWNMLSFWMLERNLCGKKSSCKYLKYMNKMQCIPEKYHKNWH